MAEFVIRTTTIIPKEVVVLPEGQIAAPNTRVDLPEAYGDHLVAEKLAVRAEDIDPGESEPLDEERKAAIREAIEALEDGDFTSNGKPKTDAIDVLMPEGSARVTAKERDAVWTAMQDQE
ncbi:hypothetical protein [Roseovarius confluentis]|uniref:hypothetical protein n=1 Tax=Roseovarius confluentis TaxID=1852027 RepID=UPI003BADBCF8